MLRVIYNIDSLVDNTIASYIIFISILNGKFQRLADILYTAAEDGGYVDPYKVEQILKVPSPKTPGIANTTPTVENVTGLFHLYIYYTSVLINSIFFRISLYLMFPVAVSWPYLIIFQNGKTSDHTIP